MWTALGLLSVQGMPHASSMVMVVRRISRRHPLECFAFLAVFAIALLVAFPSFAYADEISVSEEAKAKSVAIQIAAMQNELVPFGKLPDAPKPTYLWKIRVPITAYSSEVGQTDSTPFITANGTHVHEGTIAANFLPFGTKVKIPRLFGDRVFIVEDRMNARYDKRVDVWMPDTPSARRFGLRNAEIEVYGKD